MGKVTATGMDLVTEQSGHQATGMAVSVCITPAAPSPLPIPYPTMGSVGEGITDPPMRTKAGGAAIMTVGSCMTACHGNEAGTLKEVVSLNTGGPCFPIMGAVTVLIELGMAGITGSPGFMNKAITVGAPAMGGGGGGGGGGGDGGGGGAGPGGSGKGGDNQSNSGGSGGSAGSGSGGGGAGGAGSSSNAGKAGGPPPDAGQRPPGKGGESSGAADAHTCQGGHPVNLVTGDVVDQAVDLELSGLIPVVFKRFYSSARFADQNATLGPGWAHGLEQTLIDRNSNYLLREGEGREICFSAVPIGGTTFHRRERLELSRPKADEYRVYSLDTRLTRVFSIAPGAHKALLRTVEDNWGNRVRYEYRQERLVSVVDAAGRVVRVDWTGDRVSAVSVEGGGATHYEYAPNGFLIGVRDAAGNSESFEYDDWGRMVATTTKGGVRFIYEYDQLGRCGLTTGPNKLFYTRIEYDVAQGRTTVHGAEPRVYRWNELGLAERESLPDGTLLEEVAYDQDGLLTAKVDGSTEGYRYAYDERGNLIEEVDPHGLTRRIEYEHDLPVRVFTPDARVTQYRYEAHGALSWIEYPTGETYQFEYDQRGRLARAFGPRGTLTSYEYDAASNVIAETDARGARSTYTYDAAGRPTSRKDSLNRVTRVRYDALGRRSALELPDGTTRLFEHDAAGRLSAISNGLGQTTRLAYSGINALTRVELPDGRAYQLSHSPQEKLLELKNPLGESHSYERDLVGRVVVERTFDGRELKYGYAAGGKLARIDYPEQSYRRFEYTARGDLLLEESADLRIEYERDIFGRLMATRSTGWNEEVTTEFERDANGRVLAEIQQGRRVAYVRDAQGLVTERVLPNGAKTKYEYDTAGTPLAIEHDGYRLAFERDETGRETARNGGSHLRVEQRYDELDRLLERRVLAPEVAGLGGPPSAGWRTAAQRRYRYDRAGRVEQIDDTRWGSTSYRYDIAGRLLESRQQALQEAFSYDAADSIVGWIIQQGDSAATATRAASPRAAPQKDQAQVGPGNVLLRRGSTEYRYDARGRRTAKITLDKQSKKQTTLYDWDGRDRLRRILRPDGVQLNYSYDAFGRRVHKMRRSADGELHHNNFIWDGEVLAAEIDAERGPRVFVHEPGGFEPILQQQGGEVFLTVNDHLGMPKDLVSSDGLVVWSAAHSAYGRVVAVDADLAAKARYGEQASSTPGARGTATPVESPFRLLGQVADEDAELGWTRFRCFDAESGRWLTPDPLEIEGGLNLVALDGAPSVVSDPLGLNTGDGDPHAKDIAKDLLAKNKGSVSKSLPELNQMPLSQDKKVEVLEEMYKGSGRDTGGTQTMPDGTKVLLSRRIGQDQPVLGVSPDGQVKQGTATIGLTGDMKNPIEASDVKF
ncbi:MAG TPA: DUF6531 domain-containing protein [Polyangiaceae bacterium]|jgi:RHS repeat-associated protein